MWQAVTNYIGAAGLISLMLRLESMFNLGNDKRLTSVNKNNGCKKEDYVEKTPRRKQEDNQESRWGRKEKSKQKSAQKGDPE